MNQDKVVIQARLPKELADRLSLRLAEAEKQLPVGGEISVASLIRGLIEKWLAEQETKQ